MKKSVLNLYLEQFKGKPTNDDLTLVIDQGGYCHIKGLKGVSSKEVSAALRHTAGMGVNVYAWTGAFPYIVLDNIQIQYGVRLRLEIMKFEVHSLEGRGRWYSHLQKVSWEILNLLGRVQEGVDSNGDDYQSFLPNSWLPFSERTDFNVKVKEPITALLNFRPSLNYPNEEKAYIQTSSGARISVLRGPGLEDRGPYEVGVSYLQDNNEYELDINHPHTVDAGTIPQIPEEKLADVIVGIMRFEDKKSR